MRTSLILLAFLFSPASRTQLASAQTKSPEMVAADYYAAVRAADWRQVAKLTHPETRRQVKAFLTAASPNERGGSSFPMLSREQILSGLHASLEEVRAMDPELLLERLLSRGVPDPVRSVLIGTENDTETQILGHVDEGDSLVHVIRRATFSAPRPERSVTRQIEWDQGSRMDVITLKLDGPSWRVIEESAFRLVMLLQVLLHPA
ncbi:MAG TPA: hypothetical protein VM166_09655 [Gemmatimonadaceae bacterium]|nr:hypothetical protein [Gemmatimonadaceae bacterium]